MAGSQSAVYPANVAESIRVSRKKKLETMSPTAPLFAASAAAGQTDASGAEKEQLLRAKFKTTTFQKQTQRGGSKKIPELWR